MNIGTNVSATDSREPLHMHPRRPPLCYARARPAEVAADHRNTGAAALTSLTIVTAAVMWLAAYSGLTF